MKETKRVILECKKIIELEIKWCRKANKSEDFNELSDDYKDGFVAGLEQAKYLLTVIEKNEDA